MTAANSPLVSSPERLHLRGSKGPSGQMNVYSDVRGMAVSPNVVGK